MKKLLVIAVLANLSFSTLAYANVLDDIRAEAKRNKQSQLNADKEMLENGEISIEYAQRYVREVGRAGGVYFREIYAYIYAEKGNQIKWTPELLTALKKQTNLCQQASEANLVNMKENALIEDGASGDTFQLQQVREKLRNRDIASEDRKNRFCMGVQQANGFAEKFIAANPNANVENKDLFSK